MTRQAASNSIPLTAVPDYAAGARFDVRVFDVEYRRDDGHAWLARIYQPQGDGPFPALLDVHGGVWSRADRTSNAPIDETLAAGGLVVAAVDFRMSSQAPYPASLADVNYATRWLKVHAADFNAVPASIGGLGASSGGHLIMLSAMRPHDPRYAALPLAEAAEVDASLAYVIACWPVLDPYARYFFAQETGRDRLVNLTDQYFQTLDAMQEGNPQLILERGEPVELPPALIVIGSDDGNLPPTLAERFVTAYCAAGGVIELAKFPGAPHEFALSPGPFTARALDAMKSFIARQLATAVSLS